MIWAFEPGYCPYQLLVNIFTHLSIARFMWIFLLPELRKLGCGTLVYHVPFFIAFFKLLPKFAASYHKIMMEEWKEPGCSPEKARWGSKGQTGYDDEKTILHLVLLESVSYQ